VDILPTVLDVLGVPQTHAIDGRVLGEALAGGTGPEDAAQEVRLVSGNAGRRSHLSALEFGRVSYLTCAWTE
jgi:arylsulfatase A-like enzyme